MGDSYWANQQAGGQQYTPPVQHNAASDRFAYLHPEQQSNVSVAPQVTAPTVGQSAQSGTRSEHLFDPYQQYIPEAMNTNQPIYNPTAILQAYQKHLPEFIKAAQGPDVELAPSRPPQSQMQESK